MVAATLIATTLIATGTLWHTDNLTVCFTVGHAFPQAVKAGIVFQYLLIKRQGRRTALTFRTCTSGVFILAFAKIDSLAAYNPNMSWEGSGKLNLTAIRAGKERRGRGVRIFR